MLGTLESQMAGVYGSGEGQWVNSEIVYKNIFL